MSGPGAERATRGGSWTSRKGAAAAGAVIVVLSLLVAPPADAARASVVVKTIPSVSVAPGEQALIEPVYVARSRAKVRSARVSVRRSTTWIARGVRSVRLAPGTYSVRTTVKYRPRTGGRLGRLRSVTRTQTLRVTEVPAPAPTQPQSSVAVTGAPCDATTLRKADGSAWRCSFSDEFSGTTLDHAKWVEQETSTSDYQLGGDCFVNRPENVSVGGGELRLTVRAEATSFRCASPSGGYQSRHTAGMVTTWNRFTQAYGRFEIRAAFPTSTKAGLHSALWLWPENSVRYGGWPLSGEIDIAEFYTSWPDRVIPFLHYGATASADSVTNNYCMVSNPSAFHTYTLEWTATTMTIAYDGKVCVKHRISPLAPLTGSAPFDRPFLMALTQGLGLGDNAVTSSTPLPATTRVDYVRVWS